MNILTPALVVVVTSLQDWRRVVEQGWYRIPLQHAPDVMAAEYLAFYFTRRFGNDAWHVAYYAPVLRYNLVQRRDILPEEPTHPRAEHWYYRVALDDVQRLARPIPSRRLRRITFIPTTLEQLHSADDVAELWQTNDEATVLWRYFPDVALKATRRLALEEDVGVYHLASFPLCRQHIKMRTLHFEECASAPRCLAPKAASPLATKPFEAHARMVPKAKDRSLAGS